MRGQLSPRRPAAGRVLALMALCLWMTVLLGGLAAAQAQTAPVFPALTGRVVDEAAIIAADRRAAIEAKLAAHEAKTTDQVVVATIRSLQGREIEDYANRLFREWKLGEAKTNNGVLLIVAPNERKLRIEVGYGLEGALTDALSKVIITTAIAPKFKAGDFAGGIEAGVDGILAILSNDAEEWQRRAKVRDDQTSLDAIIPVIIAAIFIAIFLSAVINSMRRQAHGARWHRTRDGRWIVVPDSGINWGGSSSGGSGWSGGSSSWGGGSSGGGGFSGGGGSSGGGGASGDW